MAIIFYHPESAIMDTVVKVDGDRHSQKVAAIRKGPW